MPTVAAAAAVVAVAAVVVDAAAAVEGGIEGDPRAAAGAPSSCPVPAPCLYPLGNREALRDRNYRFGYGRNDLDKGEDKEHWSVAV